VVPDPEAHAVLDALYRRVYLPFTEASAPIWQALQEVTELGSQSED
jgi:hypothetical protein